MLDSDVDDALDDSMEAEIRSRHKKTRHAPDLLEGPDINKEGIIRRLANAVHKK